MDDFASRQAKLLWPSASASELPRAEKAPPLLRCLRPHLPQGQASHGRGRCGDPRSGASRGQTVLNHMLAGLDLLKLTRRRGSTTRSFITTSYFVYSTETMLALSRDLPVDEITMDSMAKRVSEKVLFTISMRSIQSSTPPHCSGHGMLGWTCLEAISIDVDGLVPRFQT